MTCKEFQRLMYLREDERDPSETVAMDGHRLECAACASAEAGLAVLWRVTRGLSEAVPVFNDPLLFTNEVAARIERETIGGRVHTAVSLIDRCMEFLLIPAIRTALASILLCLTAAFTFEYVSGYITMKEFERRITSEPAHRIGAPIAAGIGQENLITAASDLSKLLTGKKKSVELSENWVMINKHALEEILVLYTNLKNNPSQIPPEIRAANPELIRMLESKPDSQSVERLVKNRESLIRELNLLLPKTEERP